MLSPFLMMRISSSSLNCSRRTFRAENKHASPRFFPPPVGQGNVPGVALPRWVRGNVPGPLSLNDQALSRMRFTLVASSFLRLNSEEGVRDLEQVLPFIAQCLGAGQRGISVVADLPDLVH